MKILTRLRAKFFSTPRSEIHEKNVLLLIDLYKHERGGHFGPWLHWFASEFSKRFDILIVLTPDPDSTKCLFNELGASLPENIQFAELPHNMQRRFRLNSLLKSLDNRAWTIAAFIMWGYDLLECRSLQRPSFPWATLIGISWLYRGKETKNSEKERKLLEIVDKDNSCKAFFQPDSFLEDRLNSGVWVTDVENVNTCKKKTALIESILNFKADNLCVGVFGMLHGYRCVNELLLLAREQTQIQFVLAGKVFFDGIHKELLVDLESGVRENLFIYADFIETEEELNTAIATVDGIFIDSCHYPVQSGIVCRALHFGKWILSSTGNSWTNDVIADGGVGHTYPARDNDLLEAWKEWKTRGGEQRSRDYSMKLRDPVTVARCFDKLTSRLLESDRSRK